MDSLWGRAKWQLLYSWRHPRVTRTEADEDRDRRRQTHSGDERSSSSLTADDIPEWRRRDLILLLSCNLLTPEPMKDAAVSAAPDRIVEPPQFCRSWTCFQENVSNEALTVPSSCASWSNSRLTTKPLTLRLKVNSLVFFVHDGSLCPRHLFFFVL